MSYFTTGLADEMALNVPEPAVARHPDLITRPRELRQWLADLPLFDPEQLVRQLCHQLSLLITDPEPDSQYSKLLQAYHPVITELLQQAEPLRSSPIESRGHAQAGLLRGLPHLLRHLADGHARAVSLCMERGKPPQVSDLFEALLLNHRLLYDRLCDYRPVPEYSWQQSVQLYNIATLYSLQGKTVDSALRQAQDPNNVHDLFLLDLTLLLTDPYRLPIRCIGQLRQRLPLLVSHLAIQPYAAPREALPLDLSGQHLPLHFARRPDPTLPTHYLPVDALLQQLQAEAGEDDDCYIEFWLQHGLSTLQARQQERRHPRQPRQANYYFITGLAVVHRRLRALQPGQEHLREGDDCDPAVCGTPCTQLDISASGASFALARNQRLPEPGEWALFELDASGGPGMVSGFVGQIRRCRRDADDDLHIGVERAPGAIIPVNLGPLDRPALLNADQKQGLYRLIAPSEHFEVGREDRLHGTRKDYRVRHLRLLSRDRHCDLIEIGLLP